MILQTSLQYITTHCELHCNKLQTSLQHTATTTTHCNTLRRVFLMLHTSARELCFRMLLCAAACCSVLQRVAVCCNVLQCVAVCCSVLQCVTVCCSVYCYVYYSESRGLMWILWSLCVLQCVAVCCRVQQCAAVCCSVLKCVAVCCSVLQCSPLFALFRI